MAIVNGFSHLTVLVTDLDRSERFYREVFGLDLIGRNLIAESEPNSLLAMNTRQRVVLVQVPQVQPTRSNSSSVHHGWLLTAEQFARAQERLKSMGFDVTDSRKQFRALGESTMDVTDPDGHWYQVQAYGPEAKEVIVENVGEIVCGKVEDYPVGSVKAFVKGKFFLVRHDGGFLALSRWCTHMNGLLGWKQEHWHFYCPMHGATYNRKGECVSPDRKLPPLRSHPVIIASDGTIIVRPDESASRETFELTQLTPVCRTPAPSDAG
jgi:catechol 2,3-dioxygenase-like lactoylglutathione lyase family enzyme/nitrite reductase/ring-hydroxylating ferredoxin subunit